MSDLKTFMKHLNETKSFPERICDSDLNLVIAEFFDVARALPINNIKKTLGMWGYIETDVTGVWRVPQNMKSQTHEKEVDNILEGN
jgi:hypothetical protein